MSSDPGESGEAAFRRFHHSGNPGDLAMAFRALAPSLASRARARVRDSATAEDLAQATFLAAIESRERFDAARSPRAWLFGILDHLMDRYSRRHRRSESLSDEPLDPSSHVQDIERKELARLVMEGIAKLPPDYRDVLHGILLEGRTAEELAHTMGKPSTTVRSQFKRGLERLRRGLPTVLAALARAAEHVLGIARAHPVLALGCVAAAIAWSFRSPSAPPKTPQPIATREIASSPEPTTTLREGDSRPAESATATSRSDARIDRTIRRVRGRVVRARDGTPLPSVELELWQSDVIQLRVSVDAEGRFELDAPAEPAILRTPFARATAAIERDTAEVLLEVPPGVALTGRVQVASGAAAPFSDVLLDTAQGRVRIATSDEQGHFLATDLTPGVVHRVSARGGNSGRDTASETVEVIGTSGETLRRTFALDRDAAPFSPMNSGEIDTAQRLRVAFDLHVAVVDGSNLEAWEAILVKPYGETPIATARIHGGIARFEDIEVGDAQCILTPPSNRSSETMPRLSLIPTTARRTLLVDGQPKSIAMDAREIPRNAVVLRGSALGGRSTAKRWVVALDRLGRPGGVFPLPQDGGDSFRCGPLRDGDWIVAFCEGGQPVRYLGSHPASEGRELGLEVPPRRDPANLRFALGGQDEPIDRDFAFTLCVGEAVALLDPIVDHGAAIRLDPGQYVLYWRRGTSTAGRVALTLEPGDTTEQLESQPCRTLALTFAYHTDARPADGRAAIDLVVADGGGITVWRERLLLPLDAAGQVRIDRAIPGEPARVVAEDRRGAIGSAAIDDKRELLIELR